MFLEVLDLFKEAQWVSVGQKATKLQAAKVEGSKKICRLAAHAPLTCSQGSSPRQWDHPQSLTTATSPPIPAFQAREKKE